jgi:predicted GTPase
MAMFSPQDKIKHIEEALRWLRMKTPMSMSAREAKDLQDEITRMEKELQDENMSLIAQQMVNDMMKAQMQAGQITPVERIQWTQILLLRVSLSTGTEVLVWVTM